MQSHQHVPGSAPGTSAAQPDLEAAVARLVSRLDEDTVAAHSLGPLVAADGDGGGDGFVQERRTAQMLQVLARAVLERARAGYAGRMVVIKGPEIAALYASGERVYGDLDILVDDPGGAREALLAAGFEPFDIGIPVRPHHLLPVMWPGTGLPIEIHRHVNWPRYIRTPPNAEIFAAAVPSRLGIDGLEAPAPAHHAVITAAHSWKNMPLPSCFDLVDIALLARQAERAEIDRA